MKIGLLGDTHANYGWLMYALNKFNREGITTILQVGDFGIWPGEENFQMLRRVNFLLKNYRQTMYVVPGNHEDYDQIEDLAVNEEGWQDLSPRILLAPRGHRWEWDGVSFVALGGAPSVDRYFRLNHERKSWWEQEAITEADVQKVIDGGHADVMVCHDAPAGVQAINERIAGNPNGYKVWDLEYAEEGRQRLTEAFKAVAPHTLLHGHYHFLVDEHLNVQRGEMWHRCHVLGLAKDNMNFSLGEFDTTTRKAKPWDILLDHAKHKFV